MENYHASHAPNPDEWLEFDESTRIELVKEYHNLAGIEFQEGAIELHAMIHVVVENQIAMGADLVPETITKLMRQGLSRHDAIHAVGAILADDIFEIITNNQEFNKSRYRKRLDKLTAKRWKKGKF